MNNVKPWKARLVVGFVIVSYFVGGSTIHLFPYTSEYFALHDALEFAFSVLFRNLGATIIVLFIVFEFIPSLKG